MKRKVVIQSAFGIEYTCVPEHMIYASDNPEARNNIPGMDFLAHFREIIYLRNSMLILTVVSGECVELSPYLDKCFPYFLQGNSVELSQDSTIPPYAKQVLTKDQDKLLFRKGTSFQLHKIVLDTGT